MESMDKWINEKRLMTDYKYINKETDKKNNADIV